MRWPLAKLHQLQPAGGDEAVDVGDERLGHRVHQRRGGVVVAAVADEEALHPAAVGQPGLPHVEIHPVDRLHLEDRRDRRGHQRRCALRSWLAPVDGRPAGPPTARCGSYTGPARRSRSQSRRPEPPTPTRPADACLRAWGAARLVVFVRRPGGQSQFAAPAWAPPGRQSPVRAAQDLIHADPRADLRVPKLARRVGMSVRHFTREFTRALGSPPADYVEQGSAQRRPACCRRPGPNPSSSGWPWRVAASARRRQCAARSCAGSCAARPLPTSLHHRWVTANHNPVQIKCEALLALKRRTFYVVDHGGLNRWKQLSWPGGR